MNTNFNTIESIRTNSEIINKSEAYLAACDQFELQASKFAINDNVVSRNSSQQVSLEYEKAKNADNEYSVYAYAHSCEKWLEKSWNNAD